MFPPRWYLVWFSVYFKDGLSLKIKIKNIHMYFIATQYVCIYALVEDLYN